MWQQHGYEATAEDQDVSSGGFEICNTYVPART